MEKEMKKQLPTIILIAVLVVGAFAVYYLFKQGAGTGRAFDMVACQYKCADIALNMMDKGESKAKIDAAKAACLADCNKQAQQAAQQQLPGDGTTSAGGPGTITIGGGSGGTGALPCKLECGECAVLDKTACKCIPSTGKECNDGKLETCEDACDSTGKCKGTIAKSKLCGDLQCGYYAWGCKDNKPVKPECGGCLKKGTCTLEDMSLGFCENCRCVSTTVSSETNSYSELCRKCAPKDAEPGFIEKCIEVGSTFIDIYGYAGSPKPKFDSKGECTGFEVSWDLMKIAGDIKKKK
jgi:hypothetical protein